MFRVCFLYALLALSPSVICGEPRTPTLFWASEGIFNAQAETHVSYETVKFSDLWSSLLVAIVKGRPTELLPTPKQRPNVLLLFVSTEKGLWQLSGDPSVSQPLTQIFGQASSRFVFNNVYNPGGNVINVIPTVNDAANINSYFVGKCSLASEQTIGSSIDSILKTTNEAMTQVVVVCGEGRIEAEMEQVKSIDQTLRKANVGYVMLFLSEMNSSIDETAYRNARTLKADDEEETVARVISRTECDLLCHTRVKFLEGIILALILAMAFTAGLCCMHILDAPSQFEKPDDADS